MGKSSVRTLQGCGLHCEKAKFSSANITRKDGGRPATVYCSSCRTPWTNGVEGKKKKVKIKRA